MSQLRDGPHFDYGPSEDGYRTFSDTGEDGSRGVLILALVLGVLLIFAAVIWNTYRQGVRPADGGLPVIAGDEGPYKRAPEDPGGLQVAGQDRGLYNQMDGLGDPAVVSASAVRNPVDLRRSEPTLSGGLDDLPPLEGEGEQPAAPQPLNADQPMQTAEMTADIKSSSAMDGLDPRDTQLAQTGVRTAALQPVALPSTRNEAERRSATSLSMPEPALAALEPSAFDISGPFLVQLLAARSEPAVEAEWRKIKAAHPRLYAGAALKIQRADLGARGIFYRLRLGQFTSRDRAQAFCAGVKSTGRDCIVIGG
ncbi:MAG: SPOR domain-containing protein [Pseudomonadota bacterium]